MDYVFLLLAIFVALLTVWSAWWTIRHGMRSEFVRDMPLLRVARWLVVFVAANKAVEYLLGTYRLGDLVGTIFAAFLALFSWMALWSLGFLIGRWKRERGVFRSR